MSGPFSSPRSGGRIVLYLAVYALSVLAGLLGLQRCSPQAQSAGEVPVTGAESLVRLHPGSKAPGGWERVPDTDWYVVRESPAQIQASKRPEVAEVTPRYILSIPSPVAEKMEGYPPGIQAVPFNDPMGPQQYSLTAMQVPEAWSKTYGDGVYITILDTGIDLSHPDIGKYLGGQDFIERDFTPQDQHGHGTHVYSIAAALTNNGIGMAGVARNTKVSVGRVLGANGSGTMDQISTGIRAAVDASGKARLVINMSLGCQCDHPLLREALKYAWDRGKIVVAAAGNEATNIPHMPASDPHVIGVGAVDRLGKLANFSNFGPNVKVVAPGVDVIGAIRGGTYQGWNGTSMASPNVAGVVALIWAAHPTWSNVQVRDTLIRTATPLGDRNLYGAGLVNALRGVQAGESAPWPLPTSLPTGTPAPDPDDFDRAVVVEINTQRASRGLSALVYEARLQQAAELHNRNMDVCAQGRGVYGCFAHQLPGEPDPWARMRQFWPGMISGSEVIAQGYQTPQAVVQGWTDSPGHNAIIYNGGSWNRIGCDHLRGGGSALGGLWWTCNVARGSG